MGRIGKSKHPLLDRWRATLAARSQAENIDSPKKTAARGRRHRPSENLDEGHSTKEPLDYAVLPFTPKQVTDVKTSLRQLACNGGRDVEPVVKKNWRKILHAARLAEAGIDLEKLDADLPRQRVIEKLNRLKRQPGSKLPRDFEILNYVALGAELRNYLDQMPESNDVEAHLAAVSHLTGCQVIESAQAALDWLRQKQRQDKQLQQELRIRGRARSRALDDYVASLCKIYGSTSKSDIAFSRHPKTHRPAGPLIRFLRACLSPKLFCVSSAEGIVSLVKRYRKTART